MELGLDREFAYPPQTAKRICLGLVSALCLVLAAFLGIVCPIAYGYIMADPPPPTGFPWPEVTMACFLAFMGVWMAFEVWHDGIMHRRGNVQLTRVGIAATSWRGPERRVFWDEVQALRTGRFGAGRFSGPTLIIEGGGRELRIEHDVERRDELRDLIVEHAGLVRQPGRWWDVTYARPSA